jgi:hypothetical protein
LSPLTVSTKLAQIAKQSEHEGVLMGSNSHVALGTRYPQGLWSGLSGPSLTNRMSQLLTYGSVGGVGRKPGPYPAGNAPVGRLGFKSNPVAPAWLRFTLGVNRYDYSAATQLVLATFLAA